MERVDCCGIDQREINAPLLWKIFYPVQIHGRPPPYIGSRLKKWECVANPNGSYRRSESEEETLAHLISCTRICIDFNEMLNQELSLVIGADKSRPLTEKLWAAPLELSLFDGALNHNLSTKIQKIREVPFSYEFMCKAILKCMWRVIYYKIWLTRCQETIQQEPKVQSSQGTRSGLPEIYLHRLSPTL
jgi:hypothetical protein